MTDKEIIKALECCDVTSGNCANCPSKYRRRSDCIRILTRDTIELINRQQAKIEHLVEVNKMVIEPKTAETEDEVLKRLLTQRVEFIPNSQDVEDIKKEAVREFADRLKSKCRDSVGLDDYRMTVVTKSDINNLVSEMFPEQKGKENGHRKN